MLYQHTFPGLHPGKLIWQWKTNHLKMYFPLKMMIFQCHVSFRRGYTYSTLHGSPKKRFRRWNGFHLFHPRLSGMANASQKEVKKQVTAAWHFLLKLYCEKKIDIYTLTLNIPLHHDLNSTSKEKGVKSIKKREKLWGLGWNFKATILTYIQQPYGPYSPLTLLAVGFSRRSGVVLQFVS